MRRVLLSKAVEASPPRRIHPRRTRHARQQLVVELDFLLPAHTSCPANSGWPSARGADRSPDRRARRGQNCGSAAPSLPAGPTRWRSPPLRANHGGCADRDRRSRCGRHRARRAMGAAATSATPAARRTASQSAARRQVAKASTAPSTEICPARGKLAGAKRSRTVQRPTRKPHAHEPLRTKTGERIRPAPGGSICQRPAPRAVRSAISLRRRVGAREQEARHIGARDQQHQHTAAKSIRSAGRKFPINCSSCVTLQRSRVRLVGIRVLRGSRRAIVLSSAAPGPR